MPAAARLVLLAFTLLAPVLCTPIAAQLTLPESHPKYQVAQAVFDDIVRAIGDGRSAPHLRLLSGAGDGALNVAWYSPKQHAITLEEKAYDLCRAQGADSLAALGFLLAHELAHYYKDHLWGADFGRSFADLDVGKKLKAQQLAPDKLVELETEADYFGGFYGYVAGYNTLDIAGDLLSQIYAAYNLDEDIEGYPSLNERREIARRSAEKLRRLLPIFDAGNRLLILGHAEEAARFFDHIARHFPSREILNDAGVARALEAIQLFPDDALRFAYPLELDTHTRLKRGGKADQNGVIVANERRRQLLAEAAVLFEKARQKDPAYATAYINLACVADLQGEPEDAAFWAGKALRIARRQNAALSAANALIIRGIALARSAPADEQGAHADFAAAESGHAVLARLNLAILQGETTDQSGEEKRSPQRETIGGFSALDYDHLVDAPDLIADLPRLGRSQPAVNIYARQTEGWSGWVVDTGYSAIAFLETRPGYAGETGRGVRIGDSWAEMSNAYGTATRLIAARQGSYHVYERAGIAFRIDAEERVLGWMLFGEEQ